MKMPLLILCGCAALALAAPPARAAEYATTVRLGHCVIRQGTTTLKLVQCAGEPVTKGTGGVDLKTGKIDEVWLYRAAGRTILIHVADAAVIRVEVKSE